MQTNKSSETLFWEKVNRNGPVHPKLGQCWIWNGARNHKGYGELTAKMKWWRAHRFSWTLHNGPIPDGFHILHRCDNPSCVRPDHLTLGTNHINILDCHQKNRHAKFYGEISRRSKLTDAIVQELKRRALAGTTYTQLAIEFGVYRTTISRAVNGVSKFDLQGKGE